MSATDGVVHATGGQGQTGKGAEEVQKLVEELRAGDGEAKVGVVSVGMNPGCSGK